MRHVRRYKAPCIPTPALTSPRLDAPKGKGVISRVVVAADMKEAAN